MARVTTRNRGVGKTTILIIAAGLLAPAAFSAIPTAVGGGNKISPAFLDQLVSQPGVVTDALLMVQGKATAQDASDLKALGLTIGRVYDDFGVIYVVGTGNDILKGLDLPRVLGAAPNAQLQYHGDTDMVATRAREVWDAKSTSLTPVMVGGNLVNGAGIGVAVVDTGIDGTHPDLEAAVASNLKYVCTTPLLIAVATDTCFGNFVLFDDIGCQNSFPGWLALPDTDTAVGHGTHVAGIVAGNGAASDGRFTGVAPGARLYGFSMEAAIFVIHALESFYWVHCNHAAGNIRIVTNSWGVNGPFVPCPLDPINCAVDTMVIVDGLVVVFSAGNDGPALGTVNTYARNPTAGVIGVASYDDLQSASRAGAISGFSSACLAAPLNTDNECPDVSAPGDTITSTVAKSGVVVAATELSYFPYYGVASGTSMAAPHVAGVAALLLQANPALTPADVEDILEDNAIQPVTIGPFVRPDLFPAPGNPTNLMSLTAGHGLVDAIASLADPRVAAGPGSPVPAISQNPHVYLGVPFTGGADPQVLAGAPPNLHLQWTVPGGVPVQLSERLLASGDPAWPLGIGQPCQFLIFTETPSPPLVPPPPPPGVQIAGSPVACGPPAATAACPILGGLCWDPAPAGPDFRADAAFAFPLAALPPGLYQTYTVEPQILYPGFGWVSIDSFKVHVVP